MSQLGAMPGALEALAGVGKAAVSGAEGALGASWGSQGLVGLLGGADDLALLATDPFGVKQGADRVAGEVSRRDHIMAGRLKMDRLQRSMALNAAVLARAAPDLYNRVLAGRLLPQGAVVIGGEPRTDLLEQLAYQMSTGQLGSPQG